MTQLSFPKTILEDTDWFIMKNSKITQLCYWFSYLNNLPYLSVNENNIKIICESFIFNLQKSRCAWLDLSYNRLTKLPKNVQQLKNLQKIWISRNPYHCDCSMTWMIKWLNNFTTSNGEHVIKDYKDVTCNSGMMVGRPIYTLTEIEMGCFSSALETRLGVGGGILMLILIGVFIAMKRSRELKFIMFYYLKLDTVPQDDKNESLDMIEYDGFFCYRYSTSDSSSKCISSQLNKKYSIKLTR